MKSVALPTAADTRLYWAHAGLSVVGGRLAIAGRDAEAVAREHGTPLYVFDLTRITEQVAALQQALAGRRSAVRDQVLDEGAARA